MKVILVIFLTFAQPCTDNGGGGQIQCAEPRKAAPYEEEMRDIWECMREANALIVNHYLLRKPGRLQAGCLVIGPETELSH